MDIDTQTNLAKLRAQGDVKTLKKVIKDFYKLVSKEINGEELQAAHETFLMDLDLLSIQLSKMSRLKYITESEINGYESDTASIEQTHLETQEKLINLKEELKSAQRDRACRIEYDSMAKLIKALPDRKQGEEAQARLREEISTLEAQQSTYSQTWNSRQQSFDAIVQSLEDMSNSIKDEKAESDRRAALAEEEDNEEVEGNLVVGGEGKGEGKGGEDKMVGVEGEEGDVVSGGLDPNAKSFEPHSNGGEVDRVDEGEEEREEGETMAGEEEEDVEMEDIVELEEGQEREEKEEGEMLSQ